MNDLTLKKDDSFHIQRTWLKKGNIIRHKTAEAFHEYEELTLSIKGEEISYIPLNAYNELLQAVKDNKQIVDYRVIIL